MSFLIEVSKEVFSDEEFPFFKGVLKIGEFEETFQASATYWNAGDYYDSWANAYKKKDDFGRIVLITSMYDPAIANFVFAWVFYTAGEFYVVQNHIVFLDEVEGFRPEEINMYVSERESVNEDGQEISEWKVPLADVDNYFQEIIGNDA